MKPSRRGFKPAALRLHGHDRKHATHTHTQKPRHVTNGQGWRKDREEERQKVWKDQKQQRKLKDGERID